ncbi:MAG: protoporphyrinogen oxidase [Proteobacteria bacterium]|nr:protoporphyrinogen oxidase [Pseudomonadota bacterium]
MIGSKPKVIVIGGGISGLSSAFWLMQKGIDVQLLERDSRAGGLIRSERVDGFLLDYAANCVFNYLPEVNFLCHNTGLSSQQILRQESAKKRYLLKDGVATPVPMRLKEMITTDLWSLRGKLRALLEPFIPRASSESEETVSQFITRRFGAEVYERSIEPYIAGTLAGDADKSCLKSTFQQFAKLEAEHGSILKGVIKRKLTGVRTACAAQVFSFRNGMGAMTEGLKNYVGDSFLPNSTVEGIEREGKQWAVHSDVSGKKKIFHADAVILATPAGEAAKLVDPLSKNLSILLKGVEYSPMVVSFLGFSRKDIDHPLDGIGCLFPKKEIDFNSLGSLWTSTLFEGRSKEGTVLLTNYLGGARRPEMPGKTDEEIIALVMEDLKKVIGVKGKPVMAKVIRHRAGLPQYHLGHQMFLEKLDEHLGLIPGLHVAGNYLGGVSVRACISQGKELAEKIDSCLKKRGKRFTPKENRLKRDQASQVKST